MWQLLKNKKEIMFGNNFTENFLIRLVLGVIISTLFVMIFSIIYKEKIDHDYKPREFKPVSQINRLTNISIDSSSYFFGGYRKHNNNLPIRELKLLNHKKILNYQKKLGCSTRQKALIFENLYSNDFFLEKNKYTYESFLIDTIDKYFTNNSLNCDQFIRDIKILEKLRLLGLEVDTNKSKEIIRNYLTEKTSWFWRSHCLYVKVRENDIAYLAGSISNCYSNKKIKRLSTSDLNSEIVSLGRVIHKRLNNVSDKSLSNPGKNKNFIITLDPQIQGWLNLYKKCFLSLEFCDVLSVKSLSKMNDVSIVILNSANSEILGAICLGRRCKESGLNIYKDLAAVHVKSPPASISKLLFGLSFASTKNIDKQMLLQQIKTSGQNDLRLGKRNEWWEKTAICDEQINADCIHHQNVAKLSNLFGISTNCFSKNSYKDKDKKEYSFNCGNISLVKHNNPNTHVQMNYGLDGFMGSSELLGKVVTDKDGFVRFVKWKDYEIVRRNKNLIAKKIEFLNTSSIIQSVLGAGNTRMSALGIAALATQISQMSNNKKPRLPSLVKSKDIKRHSIQNVKKTRFLQSDIESAKNVILGMQKTLLKEQKNWLGNGTAYNSFTDIFGEECISDCPIKGKTGTVDFNDKNYLGTTLFTGLVDSIKMNEYLFKKDSTNLPNLAIGVIVFTEKDNSDGHYASQLFMSVLKDIFSKKNILKIVNEKNSMIEKKYLLKYETG